MSNLDCSSAQPVLLLLHSITREARPGEGGNHRINTDVERREREEGEGGVPSKMASPEQAEGGRKIKPLSQSWQSCKPTSKRVWKSAQSGLCGKDVLVTVSTEESWVTRNPCICEDIGCQTTQLESGAGSHFRGGEQSDL